MHFYTILGVLLLAVGLASAISAAVSRERDNQRIGLALAFLCILGGVACILLNVFTWDL